MSTDPKDAPAGQALPSPEEKRSALQAVLESGTFVRAGQLQSFLRFVCEMEIAGRGGELSEYRIGVEALGRPAGYSPAEDAAVRRRAIDLREKLEEAYAGELLAAPLRIDLPKGRYVPRFVRVETPAAAAAVHVAAPRARSFRALAVAFAAGIVVGAAGFWAAGALRSHPEPTPGVSYEAEARGSTLGGNAVREMCEACSGGNRVRRIGHNPETFLVLSEVMAGSSGDYPMRIDYLLNGSRSFFVSVNGGPRVEVPLTGESWSVPSRTDITVRLKAGRNTVKLYNDTAYAPDLDRIVIGEHVK